MALNKKTQQDETETERMLLNHYGVQLSHTFGVDFDDLPTGRVGCNPTNLTAYLFRESLSSKTGATRSLLCVCS